MLRAVVFLDNTSLWILYYFRILVSCFLFREFQSRIEKIIEAKIIIWRRRGEKMKERERLLP